MPMSNYQSQTNVVSSANLYEAPYSNNLSTIQQGVSYINSSAASSQYLTSSRSMPMNEKFGHADFSNPANYFQTSYAAQHVIRAEVASAISAPHTDLNSNDLAPSVFLTQAELLKIQQPHMHLHPPVQQIFCLQIRSTLGTNRNRDSMITFIVEVMKQP